MYERVERDRQITRIVLGLIVVYLVVLFFIPGDKPEWLPMLGVGVGLLGLNGLRWRLDLRPSVISVPLGLLAIALTLFWLTGNSFTLFHKAIPVAPTLIVVGLLIVVYGETLFESRLT